MPTEDWAPTKLFLKPMIPSLTRARLWVPVYVTCLLPKYALSVGVPSMKWLQSSPVVWISNDSPGATVRTAWTSAVSH